MVWPHVCGHRAFTAHPTQLGYESWWPSFIWPPALGISLRKGADNCIVLKKHTVSHTWMWHQRAQALQPALSFLSIIYTVNTCPAPYGSWNYSNRVTYKPCSWQIYERGDGLNVLVKQETGSEKEEDTGGAAIFCLCLGKHLLSGIWCHARFSPPQMGTK